MYTKLNKYKHKTNLTNFNSSIHSRTLDLFWTHSSCPTQFKLLVVNAIIRRKVLDGMVSAQLNEPALNKLELLQLRALRKILKMSTTYTDRENTNEKVFREANNRIREVRATLNHMPRGT